MVDYVTFYIHIIYDYYVYVCVYVLIYAESVYVCMYICIYIYI